MNGASASLANMNGKCGSLLLSNDIKLCKVETNAENKVNTHASIEIPNDVKDKINHIHASFNGAKHSLSKDFNCQTATKSGIYENKPRGAGWGTPIGLGLRGGGETSIANGASGWGPPPQPNTTVARGWGQPQATNAPAAAAASAWGTAVGSTNSASISAGTALNFTIHDG